MILCRTERLPVVTCSFPSFLVNDLGQWARRTLIENQKGVRIVSIFLFSLWSFLSVHWVWMEPIWWNRDCIIANNHQIYTYVHSAILAALYLVIIYVYLHTCVLFLGQITVKLKCRDWLSKVAHYQGTLSSIFRKDDNGAQKLNGREPFLWASSNDSYFW